MEARCLYCNKEVDFTGHNCVFKNDKWNAGRIKNRKNLMGYKPKRFKLNKKLLNKLEKEKWQQI